MQSVFIAVTDHTAMGISLVSQNMLTRAVPIFVATIVWLIRVLMIGTFSLAGENLFSVGERSRAGSQSRSRTTVTPVPKSQSNSVMPSSRLIEPTYHPIGISARGKIRKETFACNPGN